MRQHDFTEENQTDTEYLQALIEEYRPFTAQGQCADYIPALARVDANQLGICMIGADGKTIKAGDWNETFTLQSVSKVVSFIAACMDYGIPYVLEKVDVEPTGDAFNSIVRLENNGTGQPFNPMINAGAITVSSLLCDRTPAQKVDYLCELIEQMVGRKPIVNMEVYRSEDETADRNRSLAYYLKGEGFLGCEVEEALLVYLQQCAIEVTTEDVAMIGLVLAHDGYHPIEKKQIFSQEIAKLTKALMVTCGMYNASGKFAAFVGVPAKSGVSGCLLAAIPAHVNAVDNTPFPDGCGIGIYGPAIDELGNSVAGVMLLKHLAAKWGFSIF